MSSRSPLLECNYRNPVLAPKYLIENNKQISELIVVYMNE